MITTDPSFAIDCKVYIRQSGHKLLQSWQNGEQYYYILKKSEYNKRLMVGDL